MSPHTHDGLKISGTTIGVIATLMTLVTAAGNFVGSRALANSELKNNTAAIAQMRDTDTNMTSLINGVQTRQEVQAVRLENTEHQVQDMKADLSEIKGDIKKLLTRSNV